jgi:dolichol kinase
MSGFSEIARQLTHILAGSFALLLRWTTWWQAALLALVALAFNVLVLPAFGRQVFRPGDLDRVMRSGIAIYPLSVLALILLCPARPDIVAISWGVLAAGDGFTMVGAHVRTAPLPWNAAKSHGGLIAGSIGGALAGVGLALWTAQGMATPPPLWFLIAAPIAAGLIAGLVETVPIQLNDNISVPVTAAFVVWSLTWVDGSTAMSAWPQIASRLAPALAVNTIFALLGWRAVPSPCRAQWSARRSASSRGSPPALMAGCCCSSRSRSPLRPHGSGTSARRSLASRRRAAGVVAPATRSPTPASRPGRSRSRSAWPIRQRHGWWPSLRWRRHRVTPWRVTSAKPGVATRG